MITSTEPSIFYRLSRPEQFMPTFKNIGKRFYLWR